MVVPRCQLRQLNYAITPLGAELAMCINHGMYFKYKKKKKGSEQQQV